MIGFRKIAGGSPGSVSALVNHFMNDTLGKDGWTLANYYARGMAPEPMRDDVRAMRTQAGLLGAPVGIVRPGTHPAVVSVLGIPKDGVLRGDEIEALLVGRHTSGNLIDGKHYAKERRLPVDPKDGRIRHSGPTGSYDFTITPHKSVSVAYSLANGAEQAMLYDAFVQSARIATDYLAHHIGRARLGEGGKNGYEQGHVAVVEFIHTTARRVVSMTADAITLDAGDRGDPDLHMHCLIPNVVVCPSGRIGSLDSAAVQGLIFEADAYFHATLAQKLRDAGFATEIDPRTRAARLPVIPDAVCTLFSKRTNGGEMLARHDAEQAGLDWDAMPPPQRQAYIKASTQRYEQRRDGQKDDVADVADWRRQAREVCGWTASTFSLYGPPAPELPVDLRHRVAYDVALPILEQQLDTQAVLTQYDVRRAAATGLIQAGITDIRDVDAVTRIMREEGIVQNGEKTALTWAHEGDRRRLSITTGLHEDQERELVELARQAGSDQSGAIPKALLERKIAASGLDLSGTHGKQQRTAIDRLSQARLAVAIGSAGSGKTALLRPLVAAWREQGRDVHGTSLAWRQADDLTEAGIDKANVRAFSVLLKGLQDGSVKLTSRSVVAVDEAGLLGTRQGLDLLRHQQRLGFTVVALGDDRQARAVQAGDALALLQRALGPDAVPAITTTVRQQTAREKTIAGLFRDGRAAEALDMKRSDGTAEMIHGGLDHVVRRVAALYAERLQATGQAPSISAPTNTDAHRIGEAVRAERRKMNLIGPDLVRIQATDGQRDYTLALAKGDRVRLFQSTRALFPSGRAAAIGRNGTVLEVHAVTQTGLTLISHAGKTGTVTFNQLKRDDGRVQLAYGDATTIHTAQGSTSNEHIFALPNGSKAVDGHLGYSASTRHRHAAYLITSDAAERMGVIAGRPYGDHRPVTAEDKWANVAAALAYQPAPSLVLKMLDHAVSVQRGAVKTFHRILAPAEQQQAAGHPPSLAHERDHAHKTARTLIDHPIVRGRGEAADDIQHRITQINPRQGPSISL